MDMVVWKTLKRKIQKKISNSLNSKGDLERCTYHMFLQNKPNNYWNIISSVSFSICSMLLVILLLSFFLNVTFTVSLAHFKYNTSTMQGLLESPGNKEQTLFSKEVILSSKYWYKTKLS